MIWRGDVVIVEIPFTDGSGAKKRPCLIVQNDIYNSSIRKTIVVIFTGNLRRKGEASHLFVDPSTLDGKSSGLSGPSLASCGNIFTVDQDSIEQVIGHLSPILLDQLDDCLKHVFQLP